jgi:hypothetical protein
MTEKKTKYQLIYLLRALSYKPLKVKSFKSGQIEIRPKFKPLDYSTIAFILIGVGFIAFIYIEEQNPYLYILGSVFLILGILAIIMSIIRNRNDYFIFDPVAQNIEYYISVQTNPKSFRTDESNRVWCEIDELRGGKGHRYFSVTFYAENRYDTKSRSIIFQMNSKNRHKCVVVGKALNRYLEEMSDLKVIRMIENKIW